VLMNVSPDLAKVLGGVTLLLVLLPILGP